MPPVDLSSGTRIGPYEVIAPLGAGGMGKVYRARDPRLDRQVALKLLPDAFAVDPDRRTRFVREAQVLASLNHPNISTLHGVEESNGSLVLVLELVEGETLGDRLARLASPMPLREILPIARQIVDALDAAHERGVVHRDLKPDNIAIRTDGTVKVLDFGVAKVLTTLGDDAPGSTITEVVPGIGPVVVGTPAYMSPEQVRGEAVAPSTDVWAFGCVLYAMLTGRRAFPGDTQRETLTRVLETDPDFTQLPLSTPVLVDRLVRRCLEKDRRARLRHIADARSYLEDAGTTSGELVVPRARKSRVALWVALAAAAGAVGGALGTWLARPHPPVGVTRSVILTESPAILSTTPDKSVAITHDGTRLLYVANSATRIVLRALDSLDPVALVTTTPGFELRGLSISPDDQWVTYVENSYTLKKAPLTGGPPVTLANVDAPYRGGTWDHEGRVIFATNSREKGLQRIPAEGGEVTVLSRPARDKGEAAHTFPQMLPDGRSVLFTIMPASGDADADAPQLAVLDVPTGTTKTLLRGGRDGRYVSSGHLVFAVGEELRAIPFDLRRLEVRNTAPVSVVPRLVVDGVGGANYNVSDDGTLVYLTPVPANRHLVWVDRQGRETPMPDLPASFVHPRISPRSDSRLALSTFRDLFVWESPGAPVQLSFLPFVNWLPLWMPDGERLVFGSSRSGNGVSNVYMQAAEGAGAAERLTDSPDMHLPYSITPDGAVLFTVFGPPDGPDIRMVRVAPAAGGRSTAAKGGTPLGPDEPVLETPRRERNGAVSPDGKWLAYESDTAGAPGQMQIYVRRYPVQRDGSVWQVSSAGGTQPLWARTGDELFFLGGDGAMMSARVDTRGDRWVPGTPERLFNGPFFIRSSEVGRQYDVTSDGHRFVMIKELGRDTPRPIMIVRGWAEELKRHVQ